MRFLLAFILFLSPIHSFSQTHIVQDGKQIFDKQIVNSLTIQQDTIWLATMGGVIKLNKSLTEHEIIDDSSILPGKQILEIISNSGQIWIAGNSGIAHFIGKFWKYEELKDSSFLVREMAFDNVGNLWIADIAGFEGTIVIRWNQNGTTKFDNSDGLFTDMVSGLTIDKSGNVWVSTYRGLNKFDGKKWHSYDTDDGLVSSYLTGIVIDQQYNIMVGTKQNGITILKDGKWKHIQGPNFTQIDKLYQTKNDLIIAISQNEFSTFDGNKWALYQPDLSEKQTISTVQIDDNNFYIGTNKGLVVYPRPE